MSLQTFTASTMAEALVQVKRVLGHDAVILHTRTVQRRQWFGLRSRELIEITAGPASSDPRRRRHAEAKHASEATRKSHAPVTASRGIAAAPAVSAYERHSRPHGTRAAASGALPEGARAALATPSSSEIPGNSAKSLVASPEITGVMVKMVTEEMSELKSELRNLVNQVRRNGVGADAGAGVSGVPEELYRHYRQLIESQVAAELAEDIIKSVRLQVPAGYLGNEAFVREKVSEQLERLLPASGPIRKTKTGSSHIVALIGPTGVGKTTTLAKLAASLQLREGKRVGLITIDTYRIAAVDQLRRYADIISSPLKVVNTPEEMQEAIRSMADMDYVLIDTAGRSPTDTLKLSELRRFLDAAAPDEVHLVLSTTSDARCMDLAVSAFSKVRVDRILFTKVDEAASVGLVLNVARKVGKSISYLTTGQDVPYDIEVFRGGRLASMILGRSDVSGVLDHSQAPESTPRLKGDGQASSQKRTEPRQAAVGGLQ
jgi:flagellar biosynthesis protein FlhF